MSSIPERPYTIPTEVEAQVMILIARGDSYESIQEHLQEQGHNVSLGSITNIKKRNIDNINQMKSMIVHKKLTTSSKILDKVNKTIEQRVEKATTDEAKLEELNERLAAGEIDEKEYRRGVSQLNILNIRELTSLSHEMFNQSQIEAGKPTAINENTEEVRDKLRTILEVINEDDHDKLEEILLGEDLLIEDEAGS